jgi:peptide deformylase
VTIRPIRITGDPVLHSPAAPVTRFDDELHELLVDMVDTMREAPGVGLAAPQIGVSQQVFVWEWSDEEGVLQQGAVINPTLHVGPAATRKAHPEADLEGCLSVPDFRFPLVRADRVILRGTTPEQTPLQITAEGWLARIFQHEFDHLQGTLYIDRLPWRTRRRARKEIRAEGFGKPGESWLPGVDDFESDHEAEET